MYLICLFFGFLGAFLGEVVYDFFKCRFLVKSSCRKLSDFFNNLDEFGK